MFIDKMAAFLGIPNDKLRIVSIVAGSVDIKFEVILDETTEQSETIQQMSKPVTDAVDGVVSGGDACGGVSSGIASALADGSLNLGGEVSEMSYECNEVIEDDS
jgi:hypothetical protein